MSEASDRLATKHGALSHAGEVAQWVLMLLGWLWLGEQGMRLGWSLASGVLAVSLCLLITAQALAGADEEGNAPFDEVFFISALTGDGVPELKTRLAELMPEGAWHYPEDQVSNASERLLACEITREQLYRQLHDELPYDSTVRPESYTARKDGSVEIHQQIVIARDSQKGIVLGKGGSKLKSIGEAARKELAELLGTKVHLFLHVKVDEKWSDDKEIYEELGLEWVR